MAMKRRYFWTILPVLFFIILIQTACSPLNTPTPLPSSTPEILTATPTTTLTIVWFPPTPTSTPYPTPTVVITPTVDIKPEFNEILFYDDFSDPSFWPQSRSSVGSVSVNNNELTIAISQSKGYLFTLRQQTILDDYFVEVTASPSICRDADEYGMLIRVTPNTDFYRFSLTCDGQTRLDKYYNGVASTRQPLVYSSEVPPGAPSLSRLGIWIKGREMNFFINDIFQFSVLDPSLTTGTIGFFARAAGDGAVTVNFSELVIHNVK